MEGLRPLLISIMTNTDIRRANVKTLKTYAAELGVDVDGMTRAEMVDALLKPEKIEPEPVEDSPKVDLVKMVNEDGHEADVHPDMVEDFELNGGYRVRV